MFNNKINNMRNPLPRPKFKYAILGVVFAMLFVSCGSYQQASYYDDDGIYSKRNRTVNVEKKSAQAVQNEALESDIYGDYFGEKANEYDDILSSEIFTDVDDYYSGAANDSTEVGVQTDYLANNNTYEGNPGWGDNPSRVNINVYENPYAFGGFGFDPFFYGGGFGFGFNRFGFGFNRFGFGGFGFNRFGFGFNRFGFGGFGYPYYGYGFNRFGFGGFGYPYYGGFRGRGRFFNDGFAFNRSRRSGIRRGSVASSALRGRSNVFNRSNITRSGVGRSTRSGVSRSNRSGVSRSSRSGVSRRSVSADAIARNRSYRTSRSTRAVPRYDGATRSTRTYSRNGVGTRTSRSGTGTRASRSATSRSFSGRSSSVRRPSSSRSSGFRSSGRSSSRSSGFRSSGRSSSRSSGVRSSSRSSSRSSGFRSSGRSSSRSSGRSSSSRSSRRR